MAWRSRLRRAATRGSCGWTTAVRFQELGILRRPPRVNCTEPSGAWNTTLRITPAHPDEAHRPLGPEHDLDSALSHVEARRVANDYTIRFQGKRYQIARKTIVPGLRGGKVRVESRLDGKLAAHFGKHELALRRCLTRPESKDAEKKAAAAEKAPGPVPRRKGSDWVKDFDLKKSPPLWLAAQASGMTSGKSDSKI